MCPETSPEIILETALGFTHTKTTSLPSLFMNAELYTHHSGALHYHLNHFGEENVFMVAFRTPPEDDTGIAHILEHTTLCGSDKYPVNDPFFSMLRRSLHTFMNAMTAGDWTAYPFATNHHKDFFNLINVYLDAVFAPRLDTLSFAQEGHRLSLDETGAVQINGVVYNEMKGAMDSSSAHFWQHLGKGLFPDTPLRYNSGGNPADIPGLTYEQLIAFHRRYYCPANTVVLTAGDIEVSFIHANLESYLSSADPGEIACMPEQKPFDAPRQVRSNFPSHGGQAKNLCAMAWALGDLNRTNQSLTGHLLYSVLLGNSSAPLRSALEQSDLGTLGGLNVLDDDLNDLVLTCGLEDVQDPDAVYELILGELRKVAENGIDPQIVSNALHQLELSQRVLSGTGMPWGLKLLFEALPALIHGTDASARVDVGEQLKTLIKRAKNPDFIPKLVTKLLLDNPHRLDLYLCPDEAMAEAEDKQLQTALKKRTEALTAEESERIQTLNHELELRQSDPGDNSVLPCLKLSDISQTCTPFPEGLCMMQPGVIQHCYPVMSNGMAYVGVALPLGGLNETQMDNLSWYNLLLTQVGVGKYDYAAWQQLVQSRTGGIHNGVSIQHRYDPSDISSDRPIHGYAHLSSHCLRHNNPKMLELMQKTINEARWDEAPRIKELVNRTKNAQERSISGSGHMLAILQASAAFHPLAFRDSREQGLEGLLELRALTKNLESDSGMQEFSAQLQDVQQALAAGGPRYVQIVSEDRFLDRLSHNAHCLDANLDTATGNNALKSSLLQLHQHERWQKNQQDSDKSSHGDSAIFADHKLASCLPQVPDTAWLISGQVNHCAQAIPCSTHSKYAYKDSAALHVLAALLNHNYLHRELREKGGAYGGGCGYSAELGLMRFYSYRDPHLERTLECFKESVRWYVENGVDDAAFHEALIASLGKSEQSSTPIDLANQNFASEVWGDSTRQRNERRACYFDLDQDYVRQAAMGYLLYGEKPSTALLVGNNESRNNAHQWVERVREELA